MFVSICAVIFDPAGRLTLAANPDSDVFSAGRRITRVATLDGKSIIIDNGFSVSDNTFAIRVYLDAVGYAALSRLIVVHSELLAAIPGGVYRGSIDRIERDAASGVYLINFLVSEQISELKT